MNTQAERDELFEVFVASMAKKGMEVIDKDTLKLRCVTCGAEIVPWMTKYSNYAYKCPRKCKPPAKARAKREQGTR